MFLIKLLDKLQISFGGIPDQADKDRIRCTFVAVSDESMGENDSGYNPRTIEVDLCKLESWKITGPRSWAGDKCIAWITNDAEKFNIGTAELPDPSSISEKYPLVDPKHHAQSSVVPEAHLVRQVLGFFPKIKPKNSLSKALTCFLRLGCCYTFY